MKAEDVLEKIIITLLVLFSFIGIVVNIWKNKG